MKKNNNIYKEKYYDLRGKYLQDLDFSWKEGYEEGYDVAQQEAQQMQQEQAMMQQQQMLGQQPGEEGQEEEEGGQAEGGVAPEDAAQQAPGQPGAEGSEEDQLSSDDQAMQINASGGLSEPLPPMEGELGKNIDALMSMLSKGNKPKLTDLRNVVIKIDSLRKKQTSTIVDVKKMETVNTIFEEWEKEGKDAKL